MLALGRAKLPILDEIAPHVRMRCIEWHVIAQAKPMPSPCCAVVPFVVDDTPGVFRRLYATEQQGMSTFVAPENILQLVVVEGLNVRGIGTQAVFGHNAFSGGGLAHLRNEALGGMPFTIMCSRSIAVHTRFGHQRNHGAQVRVDKRCAHHLRRIGDGPRAVDPL